MFTKIKNLLVSKKSKIATLSLGIAGGVLAFGSNAFAAVDPDVASTTQTIVVTMKDNITGVITANISQIIIVGVIIFSIGFVWKLTKRFMK